MKNKFFYFFLFCISFYQSQVHLRIYVNTRVCAACNLLAFSLDQIKHLPVKKTYYLTETNKKIAWELIENFLFDTSHANIEFVPDTFFYRKNKFIDTYVLTFIQNQKADSCPADLFVSRIEFIKKIYAGKKDVPEKKLTIVVANKNNVIIDTIKDPKKLDSIVNRYLSSGAGNKNLKNQSENAPTNSMNEEYRIDMDSIFVSDRSRRTNAPVTSNTSGGNRLEIPWPENINLSDNFFFHYYNHKITLTDENLNKYYFASLDISKQKISLLDELKLNKFPRDSFLNTGCINKELFLNEAEDPIFMSQARPSIQYAFHDDNRIISIIQLGSPHVENAKIVIYGAYFVLMKNMHNQTYKIFCLDSSLNRRIDNTYFLNSPFAWVNQDTFYFPTASLKSSIRPFFLKLLKKSHPYILYYDKPSENLHSRLPQDIYFDNKKYGAELTVRFNNNEFYFSTNYPIFYHIKKNAFIIPKNPEIWEEIKGKGFICDVMENNQNLIFLFLLYDNTKSKEEYILYTYNPVKDKIIGRKRLDLNFPKVSGMALPRFYDKEHILFATPNSLIIQKIK